MIRPFLRSLVVLSFCLFGCDNSSAQRQTTGKAKVSSKAMGAKEKGQKENAIIAPDFTLSDLDGEWVSMEQFKGKVVLLNFWGTWCGPCRREIPDFNKLIKKYQKDGLEIVAITLKRSLYETEKSIADFVNDWDMNYTILTDIENYETQLVTAYFGQAIGQPITGIPTTLIIDREGYIVKGYIGPRSEEVFYKDLKPYLSS